MKKLKLLLALLIATLLPALSVQPAHAATSITITSPSNNATVSSGSFTVTGTATANRTVKVKVDGTQVASTTSDGSGNWSVNVSGQSTGAKTIEATASTQFVYTNVLSVADFSASRMSKINTLNNQEESSFSVFGAGAFPITWKPNPAYTKAYGVAPYLNSGTVWVMDLVNGSTTTFTLPGSGQRGASVAYNADGSRVYITDNANTSVYVYNTTTEALVAGPIAVGNAPHSNTKRPGVDQIWVLNSADSTVSVINTNSNTVTNTYSTASQPNGMYFSPDGSLVYIGEPGGIEILNASTGASVGTITGSGTPEWIIVNEAGTRLYASMPSDGGVDVYNLEANTYISKIATPTGPWGLALVDNDSKLYITSPNLLGSLSGTTISVADTASNTVVDSFQPGGGAPFFIYSFPEESATTSIQLTIGGGTLADTGQNTVLIGLIAAGLVLGGGTVLYRRVRRTHFTTSA